MLNRLKKQTEGFTIIEVLIVLAIAGLIILIVLLAVPALQRNARNTKIKSDVSAILGGTSEFASINNGKAITTITITQVTGAAGTNAVDISTSGSTVAPGTAVPASAGAIVYALDRKCNAAGTDLAPGTVNRAVALLYNVESSSTLVPTCSNG